MTVGQRLEAAENNSAELPAYFVGSKPAQRQVRDAAEPRASCLLTDPRICFRIDTAGPRYMAPAYARQDKACMYYAEHFGRIA
ncbi:hypothetical protein KL951_002372 [Ogataea haglerorum]|nr:hypothetical protein KL951_002372 [Ogataea haglerorum]